MFKSYTFAPLLISCALVASARAQNPCTAPDTACPPGQVRVNINDSDSFGPASSQWDSEINVTVPRLSVDKYVPVAGETLVQAEVRVTGTAFGQLRVHNRDPLNQCNGTMDLQIEPLLVEPVVPIPGLVIPPIILNQVFPVNLQACTQGVNCSVGQETFAPPSGVTVVVAPFSETVCVRITDAPGLAALTAAAPGEQIEFKHSSNDQSSFAGCAPVTFQSDPMAQVEVNVRYLVCREGTPPGDCVERNRRMPASLLLYPEYDNRQGSLTLLTVTNTNCDQAQGDVDVELIYINKDNCLKNDFTVRLTPCDTFTVVTSFQNPNFQRGYVYAFAKSTQTGQAITFNHLIGNLMAINGIQQFDWSVNPVAFKGVTGHRQPTDVDGDGVRDLDGLEYWEAPERLFVPRFLGQDELYAPGIGGGYASELVLINLSGGARFTTVVDFLIFNDNEEAFSAQKEFYCWDRYKLVEINGAFRNSFLKDSDHAENEILGAPSRESGWFWFDGRNAVSSAENIDNPAIYGFMIERIRNYFAADLPWEYCSQDNGDLLPVGPFGDPRPGFPGGQLGDNQ